MVRARFEALEKRQMFAASSPSDAAEAYVLMNCPNDFMARAEEVVVEGESASAVGRPAARIDVNHTDGSDLRLTTARDFSGDDAFDLASFTGRPGYLLPYIEQDNLYKAQAVDDSPVGCAAAMVAGITDGTFNTMMLHEASGDSDARSRSSVDVWEHAFVSRMGPHHDGIIAVLIGLAVDPSDPSGNTAYGVHALVEDGSVHFLRVDAADWAELQSVLDLSDETATALLPASDEYFAQFANATIVGDAAASVITGNGNGLLAATHDAEFEDWARVSRFDRGYLSPA
jgi:hypothetical protein